RLAAPGATEGRHCPGKSAEVFLLRGCSDVPAAPQPGDHVAAGPAAPPGTAP
ncbi:Ficolin-1-B, partial [Clarias magur]